MQKNKSFEDKLLEISGPDELKEAKNLLKNHRLIGAWRHDGKLFGVFKLSDMRLECSVMTGEHASFDCICDHTKEYLCEHALALIMYASRFKLILPPAEEESEYYGGLRKENLEKLAKRSPAEPRAKVYLKASSALPHLPSKWENAVFNVKLVTGDREYLGNLSNLRQLYFDKILSAALRLEDFSLQDQQIIRFLAINGEGEDSMISLNAELSCEFFHSLIDFERFNRDGRTIHVRPGYAEAVLLKSQIKGECKLTPAISVGGNILPMPSAKVIAGRAGCWLGKEGEYFFIPATCEITWLRNFFRAETQPVPANVDAAKFLREFPLRVIDCDDLKQLDKTPKICLDGEFDQNSEFKLSVRYVYENAGGMESFMPDSSHLVAEQSRFWRRNEKFEREFEFALDLFGFAGRHHEYFLSDVEVIGLFLDKTLPDFLHHAPDNYVFGSRLAKMLSGLEGLYEIDLKCRLLGRGEDCYTIGYELFCSDYAVDWELCAEAVKNGHDYLIVPGKGIARISPALKIFFFGIEAILRSIDWSNRSFELPFYSVGYFNYLVKDLPGAVIAQLLNDPEITPFDPKAECCKFTGQLRGYQAEGVQFLQHLTDHNFNPLLADEMGLGKTVQLLAFLASRKRRSDHPALIICPASLLSNWERECKRFVPDFRVAAPAEGHERERILAAASDYDLIILSYTGARLSAPEMRHLKFSYLVLDEAQHIKNPGSSNAKNCKSIRAGHRIVLTGTPLENSAEDLWSIFDFLQPGMLGNLSSFKKFYSLVKNNPLLQQQLGARVAPFIKRRTKDLVAKDLPPKIEQTIYCRMEEEQKELYQKVRREGLKQFSELKKDDIKGRGMIFSTLMKLRQICCHPGLLPDQAGAGIASAKTELLDELLDENIDNGHKVLLFSQFTSLLAIIRGNLDAKKVAYEYLDGATRHRQEKVDHFNETKDLKLFLLSLKAGGTGLNLTSADTVIIYDPWWNPAVEKQAADRTHRIGQVNTVYSIKLVMRDTIEEKILSLQESKQEIFNNIIEHPEAGAAKLTLEDIKYLLGD